MITLPTDRPELFSDNATIAAFAREIGAMDSLLNSEGLAHAVTSNFYRRHPTHWLVFLCYTGMPNPADNGLLLSSYPKHLVSEAQVLAQLKLAIKGSEPEFVRIVE